MRVGYMLKMAEGVGFEPNQPPWERRGFGLEGTEKGTSVGQGSNPVFPTIPI